MTSPRNTPQGLADKLASLPVNPGCYIYRDAGGAVLYVGKAINLRNRVRSYFQKGAQHAARIAMMVNQVHDLEYIIMDNEVEALILECNLIKKHRPPFNVRLRDDKSYPYVCVTINDPFPRVFFTRRPRLVRDGNRYFGPFTDARAVRDTLRVVRRIFGVQSCNYKFTGQEHLRPCLYFHLNQCLGPCTGELSRKVYMKAIHEVCLLLEGRHESILSRMQARMDEAAANLQFEQAAAIRDRVRAIERLSERQKVFSVNLLDQDVVGIARSGLDTVIGVFFLRAGRLIGQQTFPLESAEEEPDSFVIEQFVKQYYEGAGTIPKEVLVPHRLDDAQTIEKWLSLRRGSSVLILCPVRGEKKRLVELVGKNAQIMLDQRLKRGITDRIRGEQAYLELGDALGLEVPPVRIECYDISNLQGGHAVGSMVVFEGGLPAKTEYRHFRIKTVEGQDDFASLKEVIGRRLARANEGHEKFSDLPDLMLIDGGKGQLSSVQEAVLESGQEGLALASLAKREEELYLPGQSLPVILPRHAQSLRLVQHIRDEAHRFAVSYHRKLRGKGSLKSELDNVPGIGKTRRMKLIKHFGSLSEIRKVSLDDLAHAPGMNRSAAEALFRSLREESGEGRVDTPPGPGGD